MALILKDYTNLTIDESVTRIKELTNNIKYSFFEIGYHLKKIKENKGYIELGYSSLEEFSEDKFNLKSTSVKNMINVFEKFGEFKDGIPKISSDFEDYNAAQLTELLPVINSVDEKYQEEKKKEILKNFPATKSAKQIRKERKNIKEVPIKKESQPTDSKNRSNNTTYNSSAGFQKVIKDYLDDFSLSDEQFLLKYQNKNKSIEQCCSFIISEMYKRKQNAATDSEIFGLALHYYDEENIEFKEVNATVIHTAGE